MLQDIQTQAGKQKQMQESAQPSVSLPEEERDVLKSRVLQQPSDIQAPKVTVTTSISSSVYTQPHRHRHEHRHHHHSHSQSQSQSQSQSHSHSHSHSHSRHSHNHNHNHNHSHEKNSNAIITSIDDALSLKREKEMQRLREERLKRETEERKRTTALLIQHLKQSTVCNKHSNSTSSDTALPPGHCTACILTL